MKVEAIERPMTLLQTILDRLRQDQRYLVAGFLTLILIVGQTRLSFLQGLGQFALALAAGITTEIVLSRWLRKQWPNPISAYMTGVSIGILVRSPEWWPYAVGSMLAISQKYAIRFKDHHLFNPSNFGLCVLLLIVPETVVALSKQWTNMPIVMGFVFAFGALVIGRLGRLDVVFTYVAGFLVMSWLRSLLTGAPLAAELAPALGPAFQLFIFFMITDPRTSPSTRKGRLTYAVSIALLEALFRYWRNVNAPFLALFVVSPIAMVLEAWLKTRRQQKG
jgi:Na+-translocating ferredoxin:NAD+ oxidoreductase RnfD subunit